MLVSVVIPTHNRPDRLAVALRSVEGQRMAGDLEVIVVNDNGIRVDEVIQGFVNKLNIRLIDLSTSGGPSGARNAGIEVAEGEFVAFLDDDDVYGPDHLASVIPLLRSGADLVYVDVPIARTRVTGSTISTAEVFVRVDFPFDRALIDVANHISPTAVVCRSPRTVGVWFDTAIVGLEDWDMWLQLVYKFRYRVVHQPKATVALHRIPGVKSLTTPASDDLKTLQHFEHYWHLVTERWPASTERAAEVRRYMPKVYEWAHAMLRTGIAPDHHYYERTLRVLYRALGDPIPSPHQVEDELMAALQGREPEAHSSDLPAGSATDPSRP